MKWIGQHIYDLVSRFRNDVYLEDISTGTIASGAHLGLDSKNKIVKAVDGGGDLTSIVAGTGLSGTDLTGPIPTLNVDFPIASANLDADTAHLSGIQTFTGAKTFTTRALTFDGNKDYAGAGDGAVIHVDAHDVTDGSTSSSGTAAKYTHVNIERPRLMATNSSVTTTAAASLYVQGAPLVSTNQTITNAYALWVDDGLVKFDGALTVGGAITGDLTGNADTATTAATVTAGAQPNIDSIGTDGDTLSILGDQLNVINTTTSKPLVNLINQTADLTGPNINFTNKRGGDETEAGEDNDYLGTINFHGYDDQGTPGHQEYANISAQIHDATSGEESGKLTLAVASHNGGLGGGLILTGGSEAAEVDVTVGLGANSVVTIPGIIGTGVWNGTAIASAYIADDAVTFAKASGVTPNVYDSVIKLLPTDFMDNGDGSNTKFGVAYTDSAGTGYGMRVPNGATEMYAFVSIPQGMKATHVDIFDKTNLAVEVFEVQINATTMVSVGTGNANTTIDITDVNATATNMLAIEVTTTATTNRVYGGSVTIAAQ